MRNFTKGYLELTNAKRIGSVKESQVHHDYGPHSIQMASLYHRTADDTWFLHREVQDWYTWPVDLWLNKLFGWPRPYSVDDELHALSFDEANRWASQHGFRLYS